MGVRMLLDIYWMLRILKERVIGLVVHYLERKEMLSRIDSEYVR